MIAKKNREKIKQLSDAVVAARSSMKDARQELEDLITPYMDKVQGIARTEHDIGCFVEIRQITAQYLTDDILFEKVEDILQEIPYLLLKVRGWLVPDTADLIREKARRYSLTKGWYKDAEKKLYRYVTGYINRRNAFGDKDLCKEFIALLPPSTALYNALDNLHRMEEEENDRSKKEKES